MNINRYIEIYNVLRTKCLHVCLHIDWRPYSTFNIPLETGASMSVQKVV